MADIDPSRRSTTAQYVRYHTYSPFLKDYFERTAKNWMKEYRVKAAVLFSYPMPTSNGNCWRWRSIDGKTDSTQSFTSYYECLENAQANGYQVEATPQRADAAHPLHPS